MIVAVSNAVLTSRLARAVFAMLLLFALWSPPAAAFDLFASHEVSVQFATRDGKPLADAEVRVFAPGQPDKPVLTGHTDSAGKFEFPADKDGFWSAEARSGSEIARVMIRVGGPAQQRRQVSPYWLLGGLFVLLILAFAFRIMRARARRPRS